MMNIFLNNLNSLNNPYLAHKLSNLKENSFEKIDNGGGDLISDIEKISFVSMKIHKQIYKKN